MQASERGPGIISRAKPPPAPTGAQARPLTTGPAPIDYEGLGLEAGKRPGKETTAKDAPAEPLAEEEEPAVSLQNLVLFLLIGQMAVYCLHVVIAFAISDRLFFALGVIGFQLPMMGLYAFGLRSPIGMFTHIIVSTVAFVLAMFLALGLAIFIAITTIDNPTGRLIVMPKYKFFMAAMYDGSAEWWLGKESELWIKVVMGATILWILLTAAYQGYINYCFYFVIKEIKEEDRGEVVLPDLLLKGDGVEGVELFFNIHAPRQAPVPRTSRLERRDVAPLAAPSSHTARSTGPRTSTGLRTGGRPFTGSRMSARPGPPRPTSRGPVSSSGARPGNTGTRLSTKSFGPMNTGGRPNYGTGPGPSGPRPSGTYVSGTRPSGPSFKSGANSRVSAKSSAKPSGSRHEKFGDERL